MTENPSIGRVYARARFLPMTISGPPTLVKQDVKVSSPKALRERECALAVAAGRTKVSHSNFAVSEK